MINDWLKFLQIIICIYYFGGLFFFNRNYTISDYTIPSQFYRELLFIVSKQVKGKAKRNEDFCNYR